MSSGFQIVSLVLTSACLNAAVEAQCMRWSSEFTSGPDTSVYALHSFDDGSGPALYAGGLFTYIYNSQPPWIWNSPRIARWRNHAWEPVGYGFDDLVACFATFDGGGGPQLFAGGGFHWPADLLAKWDGASWVPTSGPFGSNPQFGLTGLCVFNETQGSALYVAGKFEQTTFNNIARWNGTTWSDVGGGVTSASGDSVVSSMCVFDDGGGPALYVAGAFTHAGGIPADRIARWDGASWSSVAGVPPASIARMIVYDDGTGPGIFAAGTPGNVLKWDGSSWSTIAPELPIPPNSLGVFDDGSGESLYIGGRFGGMGSTWMRSIARWNGSTWSGLGIGTELNGRVRALAVHDDGSGPALAAGGAFAVIADIPSYCVGMWVGCTTPISTVCFGDGTLRACPCTPNGVYGHGCPNSVVPEGSRLYSSGSTAADDLRLVATGLPPVAMTLFAQGSTVLSSAPVFGDGVRCTGGTQLRLQVAAAQAGQSWVPETGTPSLRARALASGDPLLPGSVRYYQAVYRDPAPGFCPAPAGGTFNTTNGLRVVW